MNIRTVTIAAMIVVFVASAVIAHGDESPGVLPNSKFAVRLVSDPDIVVGFFSDLRDVAPALGEPLARNSKPTDFSREGVEETVFDGLIIVYRPRADKSQTIVYMRISNDRFETVTGVRVGMDRDSVVALNGPPEPGSDELLSEFDREHGTSVMRYTSEQPYAPGGWYLVKFVMDEDDRVAHIIFTISVSA